MTPSWKNLVNVSPSQVINIYFTFRFLIRWLIYTDFDTDLKHGGHFRTKSPYILLISISRIVFQRLWYPTPPCNEGVSCDVLLMLYHHYLPWITWSYYCEVIFWSPDGFWENHFERPTDNQRNLFKRLKVSNVDVEERKNMFTVWILYYI